MDQPQGIDPFDRIIGQIDGLPDVDKARPSTVSTVLPILGRAQTYVVQTYRDEGGFYVFLQVVDATGGQRIAIPPKVAAAIYRQRDALVKTGRRRRGRDRWDNMTDAQREKSVARLRRPRNSVDTVAG